MAEIRHLPSAPISEALIDIRVAYSDQVDVNLFNSLPDDVSALFPEKKTIKSVIAGFHISNEETPTQSLNETVIGYRYESEDKTKVVQLRNDGFTFSKLKPYESWETLRDEAKHLFNIYLDIAKPNEINRIAVRYINHLNIPFQSGVFNFDDYLTSAPQVPQELPQAISSFLCRIVIPNSAIGAVAIINQALESFINPTSVPIILDIDAFVQDDICIDETLWDSFEQLRAFKNDIFFSCITEKTMELYL